MSILKDHLRKLAPLVAGSTESEARLLVWGYFKSFEFLRRPPVGMDRERMATLRLLIRGRGLTGPLPGRIDRILGN